MLFYEVWQSNLGLIATTNLNDAEHWLAVGVWEIINNDVDSVTDDADTLCLERLSALLDRRLVLNVLSRRNVPLFEQRLSLDLDSQLTSVSEVAPAALLLY